MSEMHSWFLLRIIFVTFASWPAPFLNALVLSSALRSLECFGWFCFPWASGIEILLGEYYETGKNHGKPVFRRSPRGWNHSKCKWVRGFGPWWVVWALASSSLISYSVNSWVHWLFVTSRSAPQCQCIRCSQCAPFLLLGQEKQGQRATRHLHLFLGQPWWQWVHGMVFWRRCWSFWCGWAGRNDWIFWFGARAQIGQ